MQSRKNDEQEKKKLDLQKHPALNINLVDEHDEDIKLARILMQHKKPGN